MATQRNEPPGKKKYLAGFYVSISPCWTFKGYLLLTYLPLVQQSWFLFLPLVRSSYHLLSYLRYPHFLSKTFPRQLDGSLIGNYWLLQQLYLTSCKTLLH
jgi:hypothetical protein